MDSRQSSFNPISRSYILILFAALTFSTALVCSYLETELIIGKYAPLTDAAMEIKLEVTTAHLWFEEILSNDRNEKIDDVIHHFEEAAWYARAMRDGAENSERTFLPIDKPILEQELQTTINQLQDFEEMTFRRYQARLVSGAGTEIDQEYDRQFQALIQQADKVESLLQGQIKSEHLNYQVIQIALIVATFLLTAVAIYIQFRFDRKREQLIAQTIHSAQMSSVGELAVGVAHEINNPIGGVINYAQLLLNRSDRDEGEKDLLRRIMKEGTRVSEIVGGLLHFARDDGKGWREHNVSDCLKQALALVERKLENDGIVIELKEADNLPRVNCNPRQLEQYFLNLINNAWFALNKKYPENDANKILRISIEPVMENREKYVQVIVHDRGIGIPENILPKVKKPFVTTKPSTLGAGLGLSINHEIARKHGAEMTVNSKPGEYAEVVTVFPAA